MSDTSVIFIHIIILSLINYTIKLKILNKIKLKFVAFNKIMEKKHTI